MPSVNKLHRPWMQKALTQSEKKTDEFYLSKPWRTIRSIHLTKNPLCFYCKQYNVLHFAAIVDHEKPRRIYPELSLSIQNLRSCCNMSHDMKRNCEKRIKDQEAMMKEFYSLLDRHYKNSRV